MILAVFLTGILIMSGCAAMKENISKTINIELDCMPHLGFSAEDEDPRTDDSSRIIPMVPPSL